MLISACFPSFYSIHTKSIIKYMRPILIPNALREWRNKAGLRQIDVAIKLGFCTTDRISRWEKGLTFPHMTNLFRLCAIYGALPHELYGDYLTLIIKEVGATPS